MIYIGDTTNGKGIKETPGYYWCFIIQIRFLGWVKSGIYRRFLGLYR